MVILSNKKGCMKSRLQHCLPRSGRAVHIVIGPRESNNCCNVVLKHNGLVDVRENMTLRVWD